MRESLLEILRCPQCGSTELALSGAVRDGTEIRSAAIGCLGCGSRYRVENGIASVMPRVRQAVATEINAWSHKMDRMGIADFGEEMLDTYRRMMLSLPYITEEFEKDDYSRLQWHAFGENFERFVLSGELEGESVLDVGAGRCWTTSAMAERGARAVALDILTKIYIGLETADIYMRERGAFFERVQGDMHDLPFRDGAFDLVVESVSAHHAEEPELFFSEVHRVLKRGGRFALVSEPVAWKGDEPPPEAEEGITEKQIGLFEWFRLFARARLVPVKCELEYGKSLCCLLCRKEDLPSWRAAARTLRHLAAATLNWAFWKFVFWERERFPWAQRVLKSAPSLPKRILRRFLVTFGLPTSPRVFKPGGAYLRSLAPAGPRAPASVHPADPGGSAWLGFGWYPQDPRITLPVRRAFRRAGLRISVPDGASTLELALGLLEEYAFEAPVRVAFFLDGTRMASVTLSATGMETHRFDLPAGLRRGRNIRASFRVEGVEHRTAASRLLRCRTLGMVVERVSLTGA